MAATTLYLTRHGEATEDGALTSRGAAQSGHLGRRLSASPFARRFAAVHHGPLPRAADTARLVAEQLPGVPVHEDEAAGDFVPWAGETAHFGTFLTQFDETERRDGARLANQAVERFTNAGGNHLVVTHNFLVAWLVRAALDAPPERWLGLAHGNAALTVIRYDDDRPPRLLVYNDTSHLPPELRWTGLPPEWQV
jgi:broad specificity phosphatase PhoE